MGEVSPELTAELLADSNMPRQPAISPDGRWVAYVVAPVSARERQISSVWVVPADASSPPRQLTDGTTWAQAPRWAPDSGTLWFIADGQVHRLRPDGGGAETLTNWRTPISGHLPLAGGLRAAVVAGDEPTAEDERRKAERDDAMVWSEPGPYDRLRLLDLAPADRAHAHFMAAYSLYLQGNMDGTVAMLNSFLEQWPDDENVPEARYMLATSLRALKRPQDAFAATLELLRAENTKVASNPKQWAYWQRRTGNQLANDFFEDGDIANAQVIYAGLAALSDAPAWQLPVTYQLGLCYERMGVVDRANACYKKIADSVKDDSPSNFVELKRLATWRIGELQWHEDISRQVTDLMVNQTGHLTDPAPKKAPESLP